MKAVVMAGGSGTRLRPLTINRPKPMVPMVNKPVIAHILDLLKRHGITDVVITLQYMADAIQDHFGDGSAYGMHIEYRSRNRRWARRGASAGAAIPGRHLVVISGDAIRTSIWAL
jgi:mannose-1-phosphate guanylyltransferase/phosphomannomutase